MDLQEGEWTSTYWPQARNPSVKWGLCLPWKLSPEQRVFIVDGPLPLPETQQWGHLQWARSAFAASHTLPYERAQHSCVVGGQDRRAQASPFKMPTARGHYSKG